MAPVNHIEEEKHNLTKRNLVMAVMAIWVTVLFLVLGGGSFYLFVVKAPNDNYRAKSVIIVKRYCGAIDRLNELENSTEHNYIVYRTRLSDILYDLEEVKNEIDDVQPPTSPKLISFDRDFKAVLDCAIECLNKEVVYLDQIEDIAPDIRTINEYRWRMDRANNKYEKMMYKRRYDYVRGKIKKDFDAVRQLSAEIEQSNAELSESTLQLTPQINELFSIETTRYQPAVIYIYLD